MQECGHRNRKRWLLTQVAIQGACQSTAASQRSIADANSLNSPTVAFAAGGNKLLYILYNIYIYYINCTSELKAKLYKGAQSKTIQESSKQNCTRELKAQCHSARAAKQDLPGSIEWLSSLLWVSFIPPLQPFGRRQLVSSVRIDVTLRCGPKRRLGFARNAAER